MRLTVPVVKSIPNNSPKMITSIDLFNASSPGHKETLTAGLMLLSIQFFHTSKLGRTRLNFPNAREKKNKHQLFLHRPRKSVTAKGRPASESCPPGRHNLLSQKTSARRVRTTYARQRSRNGTPTARACLSQDSGEESDWHWRHRGRDATKKERRARGREV